jgi:hypothetical protein
VRTPLRNFESLHANLHASNPKLKIAINLTSENASMNVTRTEEEKTVLILQSSRKAIIDKDKVTNKI